MNVMQISPIRRGPVACLASALCSASLLLPHHANEQKLECFREILRCWKTNIIISLGPSYVWFLSSFSLKNFLSLLYIQCQKFHNSMSRYEPCPFVVQGALGQTLSIGKSCSLVLRKVFKVILSLFFSFHFCFFFFSFWSSYCLDIGSSGPIHQFHLFPNLHVGGQPVRVFLSLYNQKKPQMDDQETETS